MYEAIGQACKNKEESEKWTYISTDSKLLEDGVNWSEERDNEKGIRPAYGL